MGSSYVASNAEESEDYEGQDLDAEEIAVKTIDDNHTTTPAYLTQTTNTTNTQ